MGVYVIREGLAEADELLPSWGLGTGQVWCMATLTCLCLQEWDGTTRPQPARAIQVTDTCLAKLTEHACATQFRKFPQIYAAKRNCVAGIRDYEDCAV